MLHISLGSARFEIKISLDMRLKTRCLSDSGLGQDAIQCPRCLLICGVAYEDKAVICELCNHGEEDSEDSVDCKSSDMNTLHGGPLAHAQRNAGEQKPCWLEL